jgi:hypothetical protein
MADETKPKRVLSPEARQRIADAQKKRWAAVKAGKPTKKKAKKVVESVTEIVTGKPAKKAAKKRAKKFKGVHYTDLHLQPQIHFDRLTGQAVQPAGETLAAQLEEAKQHIERINTDLDKAENAVDDLKAILEREYQYHSLRCEELERELERYDIETE